MTLTGTDTFAQSWEAWHAPHETVRADPHEVPAITGCTG
jgi:hypothetical protein